jgi:hypothetical protein
MTGGGAAMTTTTAATAMTPARVPEIDMAFDCDVYEPAEDTFLFLDALQDELPRLQALGPAVCVEIGCVLVFFSLSSLPLAAHARPIGRCKQVRQRRRVHVPGVRAAAPGPRRAVPRVRREPAGRGRGDQHGAHQRRADVRRRAHRPAA